MERKILKGEGRQGVLRSVTAGTVAVAMFGTILGTGPAAAAMCQPTGAKSKGEIAIEVRRLQTTLMVAALSCNARASYNEFMINYRPVLQKHGREIRREFQRRHGKAGGRHLNRFITRLANEASSWNNADQEGFCGNANAVFQRMSEERLTLAVFVTQDESYLGLMNAQCETARTTKVQSANEADRAKRYRAIVPFES